MIKKLAALNCKILANEPLSKHCSFKIGGNADFLIKISDENTLQFFLQNITDEIFFILGGGTNVLFADEGYRGIIIVLDGEFKDILVHKNQIIAGAAASLPSVLNSALKNNLSGLECAVGIPGTVGGAVFGNAGTKGSWVGNAVEKIEIFNYSGLQELISRDKIKFEYRKSNLQRCVISKVYFSLKPDLHSKNTQILSENLKKRISDQPVNFPNAGCIFKNPKNESAGKLIELCGLKGKSIGGAKISEVHANFIINTGNAKSEDVFNLIGLVKFAVKENFSIELETEVKLIRAL
ncbi:MAG: UDP-N-acetylmuramate dehydrogenase [Elusimicrobiota bacterium]|nr:UDP-N-acetylmuramate dehydrogenase [Elusimicrobiota bacterium]